MRPRQSDRFEVSSSSKAVKLGVDRDYTLMKGGGDVVSIKDRIYATTQFIFISTLCGLHFIACLRDRVYGGRKIHAISLSPAC